MSQKSFRELKGNTTKCLHRCVNTKNKGEGFHTRINYQVSGPERGEAVPGNHKSE